MKHRLQVLYEDNHLLAIDKPAGLATMGEPAGVESLVTIAKRYLKRKYNKSGNVYLGVVSRLDKPVSGVVLFARTSKAAARLTRIFQQHEVEKTYWALVSPNQLAGTGELQHWIRKHEPTKRMQICAPDAARGQRAVLSFRHHGNSDRGAWIEIHLQTGRKHQIRVQLAGVGSPVVGDQRYGGTRSFGRGRIALHARSLRLRHPVRGEELNLIAPLPTYWPHPPTSLLASAATAQPRQDPTFPDANS